MRSEKKVKTNDLFEGSFASAPVNDYWKNVRNMSKTTNNLCAILYPYFSSETGRQRQHKEFTISMLRHELGTKEKLASRNAIDTAIKEIKELGLFLINENFLGKEKTITFYIPNEKNKEIFEKVSNNELNFFLSISENLRVNNIINMETHSLSNETHSLLKVNEFKKNEKNSQIKVNDIFPETIVKTDKIDILEIRQDYYIKDNLFKETYINIEENNVMYDFSKNDVVGIKEKETTDVEKIKTENFKDDTELDKLKWILISDYNLYDSVAEKTLKDFSAKCIRESIDILISKIDNGLEIDYKKQGAYLLGIIRNWKEKKESVQETSSPVSKKNISIDGESDLINLLYSKKLIHISQKNLNSAVESILRTTDKDLFLELKEKFSIEQIVNFINNFQNTGSFAYKYTNDVARFWQFWNDINELDEYIAELKIKNEKSRLELFSKFNTYGKNDSNDSLIQKIDTFQSLNNLIQENDIEYIPY